MKERPIIFSAPMVRAILEGRKTQTRRIIKSPNEITRICHAFDNKWIRMVRSSKDILINCPYGKPSDRLWVRETHAIVPRTAYAKSDGAHQILRPDDNHDAAIYRYGWERSEGGIRWRPSIHMPRWASRINLEITGVRVERLQDISEEDAKSEGIHSIPFRPEDGWPICDGWTWLKDDGESPLYHKPSEAYKHLWESINSKGSWEANPWVWVIEFKRTEP
jgi:hypothetical protein